MRDNRKDKSIDINKKDVNKNSTWSVDELFNNTADFDKMFQCQPIEAPTIKCDRCHKEQFIKDLAYHYDIEITHPKNKHNYKSDPLAVWYQTEFRQCKYCGRNLMADGRPL